ncbi:MAG: hypothetical protein ABJG15_10020 [Hyphomonadaceae bacterium]
MIIRLIHIVLVAGCLCLAVSGQTHAQSNTKNTGQSEKASAFEDTTFALRSPPISADSFDNAHTALLDAESHQFERPFEAPDEPREFREPSGFFKWLGTLFNTLGPVFQFLFYAGLAAIAVSILYFILSQIPNIRLRGLPQKNAAASKADHTISTKRPDEKKARSWLEEADALAREGKYSEAVHLLLFRSIEDIQSRRKQKIPTALTAREIEKIEGLPQRPRDALRPIIAMVERSFFGGHHVDADNWASARQAYEQFAFGEAWT